MPPDQANDLLNLQPLDLLPLWAVYILTVIVLLVASEAGYYLGKVIQRYRPDRAEASVGALNGATLALLAFLMAFVTSTGVNTFSSRRQAVVAEANAIGTTYLRAGYAEKRNPVAMIAFVLTLSVVFLLIVDLSRGQEGLLRVSQQAMIDLQRQINLPQ
jgi:hypothetical protein